MSSKYTKLNSRRIWLGKILSFRWYFQNLATYNCTITSVEYLAFVYEQLGNPETCDAEDWKGLLDYAWSHAVISDETHNTIRESCDFYSNNTWSNKDCSQAVDEVLKQYNEIDIFSLYTSVCIASSAASKDKLLKIMYKSTSKMVSE